MAPSADMMCPHCNAVPPEREIADGWCDTCGKRLPTWIAAAAKSGRSSSVTRAPAASGSRTLLWGVAAFVASGLAAAAAAFARAG